MKKSVIIIAYKGCIKMKYSEAIKLLKKRK